MIPQEFKDHELWQTLEEVSQLQQNLPAIEYRDEDEKHTVRERLPMMISVLEQHRNNAAGYYSARMLEPMLAQWDSINAYLENLEQTPAYAYRIEEALDEVTKTLATWPTMFALKGFAVNNAVAAFDEAQKKWEQRVETLEQQLHEKNNELVTQEEQHRQDQENLEDKIEELSLALAENENLIIYQKEKIASQAVEHSEIFEASQNKRREIFDSSQEKFREQFEAKLDEDEEDFKQWFTDYKLLQNQEVDDYHESIKDALSQGESHLKDIKDLHEEVEKAAHGATAALLARDYNTAAVRDYIAGMIFMLFGIVLLLVAGLVLYHSFSDITPNTDITWQWTALKITATLLISAGATVAFKFSQNFLSSSAKTKQSDLELRAIHPFLETLDDKTLSDNTKVEFINRSFGQPDIVEDKGKPDLSKNQEAISYKELFDLLFSSLKKGQG